MVAGAEQNAAPESACFMTNTIFFILIGVWILWIVQAVLSAMQVRKYARRFNTTRRDSAIIYRPRTTVIMPFKGLEEDTEAGLNALFTQDYPDYEIIFVVEDENDQAYPLLQQAIQNHLDHPARIISAGLAADNESQKIHNQLAALNEIMDSMDDDEVLLFADSDVVAGPGWIDDMVGPLVLKDITGVTTGYRWLIPEHDDQSSDFWSTIASVINGSVACMAGRDEYNQAWGGSMALRVETARKGDLKQTFSGRLTDDYPMTHMSRRLGLRVYFVSHCLVATPVSFTKASFLNFAHRQYLITRIYSPKLYAAALTITSLSVLGYITSWAYMIANLLIDPASWDRSVWPAAAIAIVFTANQIRALWRRRTIVAAFGQDMLAKLKTPLRIDRWATCFYMTLHFLLIARAMFGSTMDWRGYHYRLYKDGSCKRIN